MTKPAFLRWAGSKKQILPEIKKYWHTDFSRYVEPFCGSASLFFDVQPRKALLSDINSDLVNALNAVKNAADEVSAKLGMLKTDKDSYYQIREICPNCISEQDRAVRFIYLNSLCFNGLYRVNKAGKFNVPYGSKHRKELFSAGALRETAKTLENAEIKIMDFEASVDQTAEGDFLYLDPPYATAAERVFTEYQADAFTRGDIRRLNSSLLRANERGVKFVLSYADVAEIECFDAKWPVKRVFARRNIAGFSGSRKIISEVLITNVESI